MIRGGRIHRDLPKGCGFLTIISRAERPERPPDRGAGPRGGGAAPPTAPEIPTNPDRCLIRGEAARLRGFRRLRRRPRRPRGRRTGTSRHSGWDEVSPVHPAAGEIPPRSLADRGAAIESHCPITTPRHRIRVRNSTHRKITDRSFPHRHFHPDLLIKGHLMFGGCMAEVTAESGSFPSVRGSGIRLTRPAWPAADPTVCHPIHPLSTRSNLSCLPDHRRSYVVEIFRAPGGTSADDDGESREWVGHSRITVGSKPC